MKHTPLKLLLSLLLLTVLASCSEKEAVQPESEPPSPQLSNYCNVNANLNCNQGACNISVFNYQANMVTWAPTIQGALNGCHKEGAPNTNMNCVMGTQTQTLSHRLCWDETINYNDVDANENLCRLKCWAQTNRPATTYTGSPNFGQTSWRISGYEYFYDPGDPCDIPCANPAPLKLKVTYARYNCSFMVESSNDVLVQNLHAEPTGGTGDGSVSMDFKFVPKSPADPAPRCEELRIIQPDGSVYLTAFPGEPGPDGLQRVDFEMVDFALVDCILQFL